MENNDDGQDGDACVLEMSGNEYNSMGALQAIMDQHEAAVIEGKKNCGEDLGQTTLAGYISDSCKATPMPSMQAKNNRVSMNMADRSTGTSAIRSKRAINENLDCAIDSILGNVAQPRESAI